MAVTWSIKYQPHGKFVTCQRPIVLSAEVSSGTVAHFRASLYRLVNGVFEDTEITMNGYNDTNLSDFSFNVAEYCRPYFEEAEGLFGNTWCNTISSAVEQEFKVRMFPVSYTSNGDLLPMPDDYLETDSFIVIPTSTMANESTSAYNDNIRLDKFVFNGDNGSSAPFSVVRNLLSNMPDDNVIDINAGFSFYHQFLYHEQNSTDYGIMTVGNDTGGTMTFDVNYTTGYREFTVHPMVCDFLNEVQNGVTSSLFFDAAGNLTAGSISIQLEFFNAAGTRIGQTPLKTYRLQDKFGCSGKTTFIFRNMRGGFDFFTATGTKTSNVDLSGSEFDRHTDFNRASSGFGTKRGQHNMTNLWNNRKDTFSLFSQPLTKEFALWVEELIMSPQVWVVEDIVDHQAANTLFPELPVTDTGLVAVNILKGSYKLHTTEKNVNFIEFKYALSENTITQKM